jgi:uncharacterized SAM-binding protein YcdF (DUF218 family)
MFFALSKTLVTVLTPVNFLIELGLLGAVLLLTRHVKLGRTLMVVSGLMVAFCGFTPIGNLLLYPLESRFAPWDDSHGAPDGILVLGGDIDVGGYAAHNSPEGFSGTGARILSAAMLAHRYPQARILYAGGSPNLVSDASLKEADYAIRVFENLGIERDRLVIERQSRNTFENAEFSKKLVDPKPGEEWLLVTSAFHMPRAMGIFRKLQFAVEPCPVDWRLEGRKSLTHFPTQAEEGLERINLAVREWLGLIAYRLAGRIDELLPGPT